ncbi:MAG: SBBP repeat-containing protein, partial [Syntrophobacteraceae bacterium]
MIPRVICNPVVRLLVVIAAILGYGHSSAYAQESRIAGPVTPQLIFSTYLGGKTPCKSCTSAHTFAQNCATDNAGNTYVTGATTVSDLPVSPNAWQKQPAAGSTTSAFVAKYSPAGKLLWCTYLGGNNQSVGVGVAVMPGGRVAVAGLTNSDKNGPFPTKNPFQAKYSGGGSDYFVTVFNGSGKVQYSTYLGGSGVEGTPGTATFDDDANNGNNIAADAQGLVYVTGTTNSGGSGAIKFPVTRNAIQKDLGGSEGKTDAFLSILNPNKSGANSLVYSSFLGGDDDDKGHAVAVNAGGNLVTVVGYTKSSDFPTTTNAYRSYPAPSGFTSNGFVAQFKSSRPGNSQYTAL